MSRDEMFADGPAVTSDTMGPLGALSEVSRSTAASQPEGCIMVSQTGGKRLRTARALSLKRVAEMRCAIRRATAAGSSWCAAACCLEIQSTDRLAKGLQPPACDSKGPERKGSQIVRLRASSCCVLEVALELLVTCKNGFWLVRRKPEQV